MKIAGIFLLILMAGLLVAEPAIEGGNVTQVDFRGLENSTYWDGLYGDVVLGAGATYTHTVTGNNIVLLNMVAQDPPCTYTGLSMHIIAANISAITLPLAAGNLAQLDAFMGGGENGSSTFTGLETFVLNSGTYNNVPTTYTYANGAPSPDFREGYLNDALGNLVFVADVVDNRPNWNGSTSDYQIMLPNGGGGVQYTVWVDVDYTCVTPPSPSDKDHKLFIPPIPAQEMESGAPLDLPVTVENRGDYREDDIEVSITDCPAGFTCELVVIPSIGKGDEEYITLEINGGPPGTYVLEVCAENEYTEYCREFLLDVLPECETDDECEADEYCDGGTCTEKKEIGEECDGGNECISGICEQGVCAACESDADCKDDEFCSDGVCEKVECPCGVVENHACIPYECCADADCAQNQLCIGNICIEKELELLLVDGLKIEGETGFFQVIDNRGEGVPGAQVFTEDGSAIADGNGYASIAFPYTGIIYADAEGYGQAAALYGITRLGFILAKGELVAGEETVIRILDSRGLPIAGATVDIEGEEHITDKNGEIRHVFREAGIKKISAEKAGYIIKDATLEVKEVGVPLACYVPFVLNWFEVPAPQLWMLWAVSIALALFNFIFFRERVRRDFVKKRGSEKIEPKLKREIDFRSLAYSAAPLALALPNFWIFNICFMVNVVALQAIGEIGIVMKRVLERRGQTGKEEKIRE